MPVGLEIYNDQNILTINETYKNLTLRRSGVLTNANFVMEPAYVTTTRPKYARIEVTGFKNPILFVRPTTNTSRVSITPEPPMDDGRRFFRLFAWWNLHVENIEYFIFDEWQPPIYEPYGLELYNDAGERVFHSSWNHLRLVDVLPLNQNQPPVAFNNTEGSGWVESRQIAPNKKIAAAYAPFRQVMMGLTYSMVVNIYGNTLWITPENKARMSWVFHWEDDYERLMTGWMGNSDTNLLVADVSNLPVPYN